VSGLLIIYNSDTSVAVTVASLASGGCTFYDNVKNYHKYQSKNKSECS
jgi:hypothetical protein